jgi:DNA-binding response OmpR family regulator
MRPEKALGLRLGAARYLVKPVTPEEVEAAMLEVLAAAREQRTAS